MEKTLDRKFREVHEWSMKYYCEDTPEAKALSLGYNAAVSDEARRIHRDSIIIDTCSFSLDGYDWHLEQAGLTGINCTVIGTKDSAGESIRNIVDYVSVIDNTPQLTLILKADDFSKAKKEGKTGIIIGSQSSQFLHHNDIESAVEVFARMGLRVSTLAYNWRTFSADGCYSGSNGGLANDGKILIKAMERYGVTVDLSHVGERSTLEAMDVCVKPPIFSHSNPLALNNHPRNITDEQAKKCAALGGVIGVTSFPVTLWEPGKPFPTIENFIDCIAYYADLVGVDHVGLGIDSIDYISMILALILTSIPAFWLGLILMLKFSLQLDWLPATGSDTWKHFILPSITLSAALMASLLRMTRSNMLEVIRQDYIRTARSKGANERTIIFKHALRNALLPVITIIGLNFGTMMGGALITETVFGIAGVGTLLVTAVRMKDTPQVMICILFIACTIGLINLCIDIIYMFVDPRLKTQFLKGKR